MDKKQKYDYDWQRLRLVQLAAEPLCRICYASGRIVPASVVDHIIPIEDRPDLRLDRSNLQSLCKHCHDSEKQSEERLGYSKRIGVDGWPIDERYGRRKKS